MKMGIVIWNPMRLFDGNQGTFDTSYITLILGSFITQVSSLVINPNIYIYIYIYLRILYNIFFNTL